MRLGDGENAVSNFPDAPRSLHSDPLFGFWIFLAALLILCLLLLLNAVVLVLLLFSDIYIEREHHHVRQ